MRQTNSRQWRHQRASSGSGIPAVQLYCRPLRLAPCPTVCLTVSLTDTLSDSPCAQQSDVSGASSAASLGTASLLPMGTAAPLGAAEVNATGGGRRVFQGGLSSISFWCTEALATLYFLEHESRKSERQRTPSSSRSHRSGVCVFARGGPLLLCWIICLVPEAAAVQI